MKRILIILLLGSFKVVSIAQTSFIKHYGEFSGKGNSLIFNSNGNYIVSGSKTHNIYSKEFFLTELNGFGDTLWLKHFGTDSIEEANQHYNTEIIPCLEYPCKPLPS